ncbi:MAG: hydantoinase/oxoprolinase family protein [Actinobacteria bacterium]|nr:hydantoinase/oxoprolinase family protein [Actinomycetota bacterium]
MSFAIGIDVGGTFTDFVLTASDRSELRIHKSPTTPSDPSDGVLNGLRELAELEGLDTAEFLAATAMIVHGTTVTTNAVLTERGAPTGLLTTEGFRDVLEMRRGVRSRTHLYDNSYVAPPPLVPRHLRLPVSERVDTTGAELAELDVEGTREAVRTLLAEGVEAIAICLMHSYANDSHEREVAEIVADLAPDVFLSVSSEVLPQVRLYERVSTTAMNSYVGPVLRGYIERLVTRLGDGGFGGVLLVMQSNGGVAIPEIVSKMPASTVLSGPAGGPVAAAAYARGSAAEDCLIFDMGGTSYDVSIVRDGDAQVTHQGEVNRHSVSLPMIDVHTIGAGGGSIGWIDDGGLLHMGPQSAGAEPGPAAYDRGGTEPTCTDADVVLGYLDPAYFLGGRMALHVDRAEAAIADRIAGPLGLDVAEAAAAMYDVINLVMAAGTKDMALARGVDPTEFPLVAAGGAGGLHAGMIAHELGLATVIVPPTSSVLCALGMVLADLRHDYVQAHRVLWSQFDPAAARELLDGMVAQGTQALEREGVDPAMRRVRVAADMRYVGQHHEVTVEFPLAELDADDGAERIERAFHARHEDLYGFSSPGRAMEVIGLHATVLGSRAAPTLEASANVAGGSTVKGTRRAWLPISRGFAELEVHDGDRLAPGVDVPGPALVERATTTVLVPEEFNLTVDTLGSLVLTNQTAGGATA